MATNITNLLEDDYSSINDELKSHFMKYICVLVSGYLENELNRILKVYANSEHCKNHECFDSIKSQRKIQNAKWCSIRPFFSNIDDNLINNLKSKVDDLDELTDSINTIVKNRHKIAHGDDAPSITKENLTRYYRDIKIFCEKIEECINEL